MSGLSEVSMGAPTAEPSPIRALQSGFPLVASYTRSSTTLLTSEVSTPTYTRAPSYTGTLIAQISETCLVQRGLPSAA